MASKPRGNEQGRRADRIAVDAETRLRPNSWSSVEVRVLDLSSLGFRAHCEARLQPGGCVTLDIPGIGAVEAQVEWQRGDEFGARFLRPIDLGNCRWQQADQESPLARLLVERANAKSVGRDAAELAIRRQILAALPIKKVRAQH